MDTLLLSIFLFASGYGLYRLFAKENNKQKTDKVDDSTRKATEPKHNTNSPDLKDILVEQQKEYYRETEPVEPPFIRSFAIVDMDVVDWKTPCKEVWGFVKSELGHYRDLFQVAVFTNNNEKVGYIPSFYGLPLYKYLENQHDKTAIALFSVLVNTDSVQGNVTVFIGYKNETIQTYKGLLSLIDRYEELLSRIEELSIEELFYLFDLSNLSRDFLNKPNNDQFTESIANIDFSIPANFLINRIRSLEESSDWRTLSLYFPYIELIRGSMSERFANPAINRIEKAVEVVSKEKL